MSSDTPRLKYAHMCRDGHTEIGHNDSSDDERCPLCRERDKLNEANRLFKEHTLAGERYANLERSHAALLEQAKVLAEAAEEVLRISDREHDAWDRCKAAAEAIKGMK